MTLIPKFDERGLAPAVVQDANTGQVLMLAWMNLDAFQRTLETGEAYFWSRSRQELWHKGATSGSILHVLETRLDCDSDTILLRVRPDGPACHTGQVSCFFQEVEGVKEEPHLETARDFSLDTLFQTILERKANPEPGSYTASLFAAGEDEIVKKVGEEAVEVILAAKGQGNQRLVDEAADLTYHTLVLLAQHGFAPADVLAELARRHQ